MATVPASARQVTVSPNVQITDASVVLATLQGNAGGATTVQRVTKNVSANTITIRLTANATKSVKVAWLILS